MENKRAVFFGISVFVYLFHTLYAYAAIGTLEVVFTGPSFRDLKISHVAVLVDGNEQKAFIEGGVEAKKRILFNLPEGDHLVHVTALGKVSFVQDFGPVDVQANKTTKQIVNLSESLGTLYLQKIPETVQRPYLWIFAEKSDAKPVARIPVPENRQIENVPAGTTWMVLTDRKNTPIARLWVSIAAGQVNPVEIQVNDMVEAYPVKVRIRSDVSGDISVDQTNVKAKVKGEALPIQLHQENGIFSGNIKPGQVVFEASFEAFKARSKPLYLGFFDNNEKVFLLHVKSRKESHWCNAAAVAEAERLLGEGQNLEDQARLFDALLFYRMADPCLKTIDAQSRITDIGKRLSGLARDNGHIFNKGEPLFLEFTPDSVCEDKVHSLPGKGLCLDRNAVMHNPEGGSIEWLVATGNLAMALGELEHLLSDADAIKGIDDISGVRYFLQEYIPRNKTKLIRSLVASALNNESAAFLYARSQSSGFSAADLFEDGTTASLAWLGEARGWAEVGQIDGGNINGVAGKRGLALAEEEEPSSLQAAIEYYEFANNRESVETVKVKASKLGYQAMEQGQLRKAGRLFSIAGDDEGFARLDELEQQQESGKGIDIKKRQEKFLEDLQSLRDSLGM